MKNRIIKHGELFVEIVKARLNDNDPVLCKMATTCSGAGFEAGATWMHEELLEEIKLLKKQLEDERRSYHELNNDKCNLENNVDKLSRWRDVKEELPEEEIPVLIKLGSLDYDVATYFHEPIDKAGWYNYYEPDVDFKITNDIESWLPIPEFRKEE